MQPTKEQVRKWLQDQVKAHAPPPTPEQIRRELGWGMLANNRK
jgi:hypothetical protein